MVDLLYPCAPSPGSFVLLWEFMLIPSGSPLNLAGRFVHVWASLRIRCKASDVNQLEAFTLAVCWAQQEELYTYPGHCLCISPVVSVICTLKGPKCG